MFFKYQRSINQGLIIVNFKLKLLISFIKGTRRPLFPIHLTLFTLLHGGRDRYIKERGERGDKIHFARETERWGRK